MLNDRGVALEKVGEIHRAEEDYGRALDLDPAVAAVRVNRGRVRYLLGRPAEAASDLEAALRAAPPNWPHRAEAEKAIEELRRVIKQARSYFLISSHAAWTLWKCVRTKAKSSEGTFDGAGLAFSSAIALRVSATSC